MREAPHGTRPLRQQPDRVTQHKQKGKIKRNGRRLLITKCEWAYAVCAQKFSQNLCWERDWALEGAPSERVGQKDKEAEVALIIGCDDI